MRDYLNIGATPCDEACEQLGPNYRPARAKLECNVFIGQIRRELGAEPDGAQLRVKGFEHDFGTYHEVVCYFDDTIPASVEYAFKCESEAPCNWDSDSRNHLEIGQMKADDAETLDKIYRGELKPW